MSGLVFGLLWVLRDRVWYFFACFMSFASCFSEARRGVSNSIPTDCCYVLTSVIIATYMGRPDVSDSLSVQ